MCLTLANARVPYCWLSMFHSSSILGGKTAKIACDIPLYLYCFYLGYFPKISVAVKDHIEHGTRSTRTSVNAVSLHKSSTPLLVEHDVVTALVLFVTFFCSKDVFEGSDSCFELEKKVSFD